MARFYEIRVHGSTELLFQCEVPVGRIGPNKVVELLRVLVAKHGLTDDEIVASHLKVNARGRRDLLDVRQDHGAGGFQFMCGDNPWAVVRVVER